VLRAFDEALAGEVALDFDCVRLPADLSRTIACSLNRAPAPSARVASVSGKGPYPLAGRGCDAPIEPPLPHSSTSDRALTHAGSAASTPCTMSRANVRVRAGNRRRARTVANETSFDSLAPRSARWVSANALIVKSAPLASDPKTVRFNWAAISNSSGAAESFNFWSFV
jgi:hypothetical protein